MRVDESRIGKEKAADSKISGYVWTAALIIRFGGFGPFKARRLNRALEGPSQPPPFSMPSKLLIVHSEVKSECFTTGCVPESSLNYL